MIYEWMEGVLLRIIIKILSVRKDIKNKNMAKRIKYKTGDIFSIEVSENSFIYGRILFDPNEQYLKKMPKEEQFSYLDWFGKCVLIETYKGVFSSLEEVDFRKVAIKSNFVPTHMLKREDVKLIGYEPVKPQGVSFPEVITMYNSNYYFSEGNITHPNNSHQK